mgnify:CR=1 FL=1
MEKSRFGKPGFCVKIIYSAVAKTVFCGVCQHPTTGAFYSAINIEYPPEYEAQVLKIVREMERRSIIPELVILIKDGRAEVSALFRLKPVTRTFLAELNYEMFAPPNIDYGTTELLMTGETEVAEKDLAPFLTYFKRNGKFLVCIVRPNEGGSQHLWGATLTSILDEAPIII